MGSSIRQNVHAAVTAAGVVVVLVVVAMTNKHAYLGVLSRILVTN